MKEADGRAAKQKAKRASSREPQPTAKRTTPAKALCEGSELRRGLKNNEMQTAETKGGSTTLARQETCAVG